ncbi:hypothetical protein SEF58_10690 [Neomoorella humiferrea]|uniref:hypothetical protein n=1 Tax=Neomoorella humiferrea TaxID=676965 RepID=UPI003D8DCECC
MITEAWCLENDVYCLFTQNENVAIAAKEAGLKIMADYYKNGKLYALQFLGSEDKVKDIVNQQFPEIPLKNPKEAERRIVAHKVKCVRCGRDVLTTANRQKYCPNCRTKAYAEAHRKAVRNHYLKHKPDKLETL